MAVASNDVVRSLQERVRSAIAAQTPLVIRAGGTKDFYGHAARAAHEVLDPRAYCGVIDYEPTELVITACSGTPLAEVEATLAQHNQMFAFEPPHFGATATLGGAVACGLAGPRRMAAGSIRDFVLGATLLDGRADVLTFGGNVMKNVAGYDVSRALAGSLGTLGMILDVSLKVTPLPATEQTLRFELTGSRCGPPHQRMGRTALADFRNRMVRRRADGSFVGGHRGCTCRAGKAGWRRGGRRHDVLDDASRADAWLLQTRGWRNVVETFGSAHDDAIKPGRDANRMAWRAALDLVDLTGGRNSREGTSSGWTRDRVSPACS